MSSIEQQSDVNEWIDEKKTNNNDNDDDNDDSDSDSDKERARGIQAEKLEDHHMGFISSSNGCRRCSSDKHNDETSDAISEQRFFVSDSLEDVEQLMVHGLILRLPAVVLKWLKLIVMVVLVLGMSAYISYAIYYSFDENVAILVLVVLSIVALTGRLVWRILADRLKDLWSATKSTKLDRHRMVISRCAWALVTAFVIVVVGLSTSEAPENLISLAGLATLVIISFAISSFPAKVPWKVVGACCLIQQVMAVVVMRWEAGNKAISWLADLITWFLNFAQYGAKAVFGETYTDHSFAMAVMPVLCFFMAVTSLLTQLGVLQMAVGAIGSVLSVITRVTKAETFVSIAAVFLGPDTPIVMIKSMLGTMTTSQLHTLFSTSLATIDAGMFPVYESIGIPASQLVSASLMSAPAAIVFSKILLPETKKSELNKKLIFEKRSHSGLLDAFVSGACASVPVIGVTLCVLIVFISALDFVNATMTYFGQRVGFEELTVQLICSYVFLPLTFLMGVAWEDCQEVAKLIGLKTIVNEYVAYVELSQLIKNRENGLTPSISVRSETIATYALCGYSNIGTVGFMVGFLSSLVPSKKGNIASMGFRALVAGSFACFSTACSAGLFYKA